jgi:hypothetical protein
MWHYAHEQHPFLDDDEIGPLDQPSNLHFHREWHGFMQGGPLRPELSKRYFGPPVLDPRAPVFDPRAQEIGPRVIRPLNPNAPVFGPRIYRY